MYIYPPKISTIRDETKESHSTKKEARLIEIRARNG